MVKYVIFIALTIAFSKGLACQDPESFLTTFKSTSGLSHSSINSVDSKPGGFVWIATEHGLSNFDGLNFTNFYSPYGKQSNGMSGNKIKQVLCDGLLVWISVVNGGLNCYFEEINYFKNYQHDKLDNNSLISNSINCLLMAKDKKLYIGTDSGLSIFDRVHSKFENIAEHPLSKKKLNITSLCESPDGILWIGTDKQGLLYRNKKGEVKVVEQLPILLKASIINNVLFDKERTMFWFATTHGLWCATIGGKTGLTNWCQPKSVLKHIEIISSKKDFSGNIWVATSDNYVYWFEQNGREHHFKVDNSSDNMFSGLRINDIFCSLDGLIWISTSKGLKVYDKRQQLFPIFKVELKIGVKRINPSTNALHLWKQYLLAATDFGIWFSDTCFRRSATASITTKNGQLVKFKKIVSIGTKIIATSSNGIYELILEGNKARLVRPSKFKAFKNAIMLPNSDIIEATDSIYWVAANNSIHILNLASPNNVIIPEVVMQFDSPANSSVNIKIFKDRQSRLIVAANSAIGVYSNIGLPLYKTNVATNRINISTTFINDIHDDGKFLWVATNNSGLLKYDRRLRLLDKITIDEGLSDNLLYTIQSDNQHKLWITTCKGLSVYDEENRRSTNHYPFREQPQEEFNTSSVASNQNCTLYFSSSAGIMKIHPFTFSFKRKSPLRSTIKKIVIENEVLNRSSLIMINVRRSISVDYNKNISLSFAPIIFLNSKACLLQYKLKDHDKWLDLNALSEIILPKLRPGNYRIYVRWIVAEENTIGEPLIISLEIKPAFYQQWWFISMCSLALLGLFYSAHRYRLKQINKVNILRTKISQDLHDNIGSTLCSISIYSQVAMKKNDAMLFMESNQVLKRIGEASREVVGDLNDTVWLINPLNDNLKMVAQRIVEYARPLCLVKDILFEIKSNTSLEQFNVSLEKRKAIYLFLKEAVTNTVKHSKTRKLQIIFTLHLQILKILVKDEGIGFAEIKNAGGNGLNNLRSRAMVLNSKLEVKSRANVGTEIILHLPVVNSEIG